MHKGYTAVNIRCEDAELLKRVIEAARKESPTYVRVTAVGLMSEAIKSLAAAFGVK